ncbi:FAD monooxygenase-like protein [Venturia nashicola]|nr:FAD monooxygenase-like protein [Venturia nashicola]
MPEFWRQNSQKLHRKLSRADISPQNTETVDYHRTLTPKSSYSSSYSAKDFNALLPQERAQQKQLQWRETQESLQLFDPLQRSALQQFDLNLQSPPSPPPPTSSDVLVVGAGPAGLMLACNLIRFGINAEAIDNRHEKTPTGRADSLQPKTIETLKQMRLADRLLTKGVKVHDVRCWQSCAEQPLRRISKDRQFPPSSLDCLDPYLLLAHQGFVEDIFIKDIMERGVEVQRDLSFVDYKSEIGQNNPLQVICKVNSSQEKEVLTTRYLIGCDGSQSNVRKVMGSRPVGHSSDVIWAVIDGELETDFPDLYSKVAIHSDEYGSILLFPREQNLTRLYIEMRKDLREGSARESQETVMARVEAILDPYYIHWRHIEWFGHYQIGQKVASRYQDEENKVFIAGDATQTMSPNASQGMNHSLHDSFNLAWKLNLAVRGLAKPCLLATYEIERRQVAQELTNFDLEQSSAPVAASTPTARNIRFNSGYAAEYSPSVLNKCQPQKSCSTLPLRPGTLLPPARATRCIDFNPVDLHLDIPILGQFRLFFFTENTTDTYGFLDILSTHAISHNTFLGRLTHSINTSYTLQPPLAAASDDFIRPERYTPISGLFTFALVVQQKSEDVENREVPSLWRDSKFTVYADDIPESDTRGLGVTEKWMGGVKDGEVGILVVRPDGYLGCAEKFRGKKEEGLKAARWLDEYFDGFLQCTC